MTMPALPPKDSEDWYAHYTAVDQRVRAVDVLPETIRDTMAATLLPGPNVTITANDAADTITISATGGTGGTSGGGAGGVSVKDYGAVGNGMVDDTTAFTSAIAASQLVHVPPGEYVISSALNLPAGTTIRGAGKYNTILVKNFSGDFVTMNTETTLQGIRLEGNGSTRTGRGIIIPAASGRQTLLSVNISNTEGYCLDFVSNDSGSQFRAHDLDTRRYNASPDDAVLKFAIHIDSTQILAAVPRAFVQYEANGGPSFDFGAACDLYIAASTFGPVKFTSETRGLNIVGSRLMNQAALTVNGHGVTFTGCDINAQITIAPGADWVSVVGCTLNNGGVINNSGNTRNLILTADISSSIGGGGGSGGTVTAAGITDATATGRSVLTAADAAAARLAIGAGTSSLTIGTTSSTAMAGNKTFTKTDVGLGNVDNTSDANKPVSTAQQTALNGKASLAAVEGIAAWSGSAWPARPSGFARIRWTGGTVRPTGMVAGDVWERDA